MMSSFWQRCLVVGDDDDLFMVGAAGSLMSTEMTCMCFSAACVTQCLSDTDHQIS